MSGWCSARRLGKVFRQLIDERLVSTTPVNSYFFNCIQWDTTLSAAMHSHVLYI